MGTKSQFQAQLASMNKTFAGAKAKQAEMYGGQQIPKGVYTGQVVNAKLTLTKKSQQLAIIRNFLFTEGVFEGKQISDMMGLAFNEFSPIYVCRWVEQMGYAAPEDLAKELENVLEAISKDAMYCKFKVVPSGQYYNIEVLETWPSTEGDVEPEAAPDAEEDEAEAEDVEGDDPEKLAALMAFASSQDLGDVEISDEDTLDSLKEKLSTFQWTLEELLEGEPELLESVGLGDLIVKPIPVSKKPLSTPKARASAPAKAPPVKSAPKKK